MVMWIISILIILIIAIFTFVCLSMLSLTINYEKVEKNSLVMIVSLKLFGITYYKKQIGGEDDSTKNLQAKTAKSKSGKKAKSKPKIPFSDLTNFFLDVFVIIIALLRKIKITKLHVNLTVGNGDAANTAMIVALLWGTLGIAEGLGQNLFQFECNPEIEICPNFQTKQFTVMSQCIFNCRCGYIMWTGIKLLLKWQSVRKKAVVPML